jgi:hypothetical protein
MTTVKYKSKLNRVKTQKIFRIKKIQGGGDVLTIKLLNYLRSLQSPPGFSDDKNKENCIKPPSKGGQIILICDKYAYKSPPETAKVHIAEGPNYIRVDGFTMNLLIQSIIKTDNDLNKIVETYMGLYPHKNGVFRTLIGEKFDYIFGETHCRSVEDFIDAFNKTNEQKRENFLEQLKKWIATIIKTLDLLWTKFQFHHCDPKAAQLFISGSFNDINNSKIIVGDLDRVTFSMNIPIETEIRCVRVCSFPYGNQVFEYDKSQLGTQKKGGMPGASFAEEMRSKIHPNANNHWEVAAFLSSILLLIDNLKIKNELYDHLLKYFNDYARLIDFEKLKLNTKKIDDKKSHKVACSYVKLETFLYSNFTLNTTQIKPELNFSSVPQIPYPMPPPLPPTRHPLRFPNEPYYPTRVNPRHLGPPTGFYPPRGAPTMRQPPVYQRPVSRYTQGHPRPLPRGYYNSGYYKYG